MNKICKMMLGVAWALASCATVADETKREMVLPPVFTAGEKILFIGDSITDGAHGRDMNHVYGHGFADEIASRYQALCPGLHLQFGNRGKSGDTAHGLVARWSKDAFPYTVYENGYEGPFGVKVGTRLIPDTVSILIGINDYAFYLRRKDPAFSVEAFRTNLCTLIAASRAANPKVRIVLCEPFRLPKDESPEFRSRQAVVAEVAAQTGCIFVPFQKLFSEELLKEESNPRYWYWDFYHPTPAAHYRMADFWLKAVQRSKVSGRAPSTK